MTAPAIARPLTLTPEQEAIRAAFGTGQNLVVISGAGAGKTSTVKVLAADAHARGLGGRYITLTKAMAEEVSEAFEGTGFTASTISALAYQAFAQTEGAYLLDKIKDEPVLDYRARAQWLGVAETLYYQSLTASGRQRRGLSGNTTVVTPAAQVDAALKAIAAWCNDSAYTLGPEHVERRDLMPDDFFHEVYAPRIAQQAQHIWVHDILNPEGRLPFLHDYYVKLAQLLDLQFALMDTERDVSVIFFDEAQDSRPCVSALLHAQRGVQIVTVGDSSQAIFRFTGAIDALPSFSAVPGAITLPLSKSWRFGANIAAAANMTLDLLDAPIRLAPNTAINDTVVTYTPDEVPLTDAVICRTNAELVAEALREINRGRTVSLVTDVSRILRYAEDFDRITRGERAWGKVMSDFFTREDIDDFVNSDAPDVSSIRPLLRLLSTQGSINVREAATSSVPEEEADVVLSTIHKAKGRQWPSVRIAAEHTAMIPADTLAHEFSDDDRDRLMLLYVALTRPQQYLAVPEALAQGLTHLHDRRSGASALL